MSQYQTDNNLLKRIAIYRFGENPVAWPDWYFDHLPIATARRILDVGCGNASMWVGHGQLLNEQATVELVDESPGMIKAAQKKLKDTRREWVFRVASIERLPYETASFDIVMANHMLYHVSDIHAAVRELARVVKPAGCVFASTNGIGHMRQLCEWAVECGLPQMADKIQNNVRIFGLGNGPGILGQHFAQIRTHHYRDALSVPEFEPVMEYVLSMEVIDTDNGIALLKSRLSDELSKHDTIRIDLETGIIEARAAKPMRYAT